MRHAMLVLAVVVFCSSIGKPQTAAGEDLERIPLPAPTMEGGKPLMEALRDRHTSRRFSDRPLHLDVLGNLLWAAFGVNRPDEGKRTAPSAWNQQEIDIYVATAHGLYLYDARAHALDLILDEDIRPMTGTQPFVGTAPINLVYVADFSKMARTPEGDKVLYSAANAGLIAENVYLFSASEGLAVVVRGLIDREPLAGKMGLGPEQRILLAQTVGYREG